MKENDNTTGRAGTAQEAGRAGTARLGSYGTEEVADIVVIGGGAAGMMAALTAKKAGNIIKSRKENCKPIGCHHFPKGLRQAIYTF